MNENKRERKHFVLVHGFCHGAWCWYKLVSLLKLNGQKVTALDLAGCGVHPDQLHQISSFSDYIRPLMDFMASLSDNDKVILVGHSYGGIPMSFAMENYPTKISAAVFVTAYMPNCLDPPATLIQEAFKRISAESFMDCEVTFDQSLENLPISAIFGHEFIAAKLYQGCPPEDRKHNCNFKNHKDVSVIRPTIGVEVIIPYLLKPKVMRPVSVLQDLELAKMLIRRNSFFMEELGKKSLLSQEKYGKIKRYYVVCEDDKVLDQEFQKHNIEKSPPEDVISIAGAGHMVMLSKSLELCNRLMGLAEKC